MIGDRTVAEIGIGTAIAIPLLILVPYAIADGRAVGVYYGGLLGPPLAGLFAAVTAIAFLGASRGRTDPPTAAGVVVVLAVLTLGLLAPWAANVSSALVGGMTTLAAFQYHRWLLVGLSLGLLTAGAIYAQRVV